MCLQYTALVCGHAELGLKGCIMLQCIAASAVCCSVSQYPQCVAVRLQCTARSVCGHPDLRFNCCIVLHYVAVAKVCCGVLQCAAICCSVVPCIFPD